MSWAGDPRKKTEGRPPQPPGRPPQPPGGTRGRLPSQLRSQLQPQLPAWLLSQLQPRLRSRFPAGLQTRSESRARPRAHTRRWSLVLLLAVWAGLDLGGLFHPGLLDDVDSIYIEVAREMLHRHDLVTPYVDGIRFFDKPPLLYWMAAASMRLFGEHDWAARLPLALAMLALALSVYALGVRFFPAPAPSGASPAPARTTLAPAGNKSNDRGGFYAALAILTSIGSYLYTRFFIPDIVFCLWLTLAVHLFLLALDGAARQESPGRPRPVPSALLPSLGFGAVLGLNVLTKGMVGLLFPLAVALGYLVLTRQLRLLRKLSLLPGTAAFLVVALPWHVLAAIRNPAIALPAGLGLPARAGWAWFYLYNEHIARFFGRRIPHDYGNSPVWIFWLYALVWLLPWAAFLPAAAAETRRALGHRFQVTVREREAALILLLWILVVLLFFTVSQRQEYYSLPALPALALLAGGLLARAEEPAPSPASAPGPGSAPSSASPPAPAARRLALACHRWILLPLSALVAMVCVVLAFTSPRPRPGTDLASLLASNPALYNLSLGHVFDLTRPAMALFRGPLLGVAAGMVAIGLASYLLRRRDLHLAANLTLAGGMVAVLLAAHAGLERFYPVLGSKAQAEAILNQQSRQPSRPGRPPDLILIDGELTSGSSLLFYTRQPVHVVNGRENGLWFGSFWPDAPRIFESEESLRSLWAGPARVFLLTGTPASRSQQLSPLASVHWIISAGGKTVLSNR